MTNSDQAAVSIIGLKGQAFIIATSLLLFFLCLAGLSMAFSKTTNTHFDFRMQYTAAYMLRSGYGRQLYDYDKTMKFQNDMVSPARQALPFDHLAYEALLYVPFSFFSYQTAYLLFFGVNLAILTYSFLLLKPYISKLGEIWPYLPLAIFACFLPVTMALIEGQDSIILLSLMILIVINLGNGKDSLAGIFLGLACFKFQYVVPIVLLFLLWGRWRFVAGVAISGSALLGLSLWLTGVGGFLSYVHILTNISTQFSSQNGIKLGIRPELMPNLRGLAFAIAGTHSRITNAVTMILSAAVLIWAITRRPSFPLALTAALLVSYHETISDASLLVLPVALAAVSTVKNKNMTGRSLFIATLCALIIVAPGPLMLAGVRFYLLALPTLALFFLWDEDFKTTPVEVQIDG
jgi:Glycosyltransferase family 87